MTLNFISLVSSSGWGYPVMACSKLKVVLFLGSVRPNRMAERVRIAFVEAIKANGMEPILLGIIPGTIVYVHVLQ